MQRNKLTYPHYDLYNPDIVKRSILYCLEPIAVGTIDCESLTSYLIRLAEVHCVTPEKLIKHKIYPTFWGHDDLRTSDKGIIGRTFKNPSHIKLLNFSGWYTSKLIESLEFLTERTDLTFLTMMHWHELITHVYLVRGCRAWCPLCYNYWCQKKLPIYEPLPKKGRGQKAEGRREERFLICPLPQGLKPLNLFMNKVGNMYFETHSARNTTSLLKPLNLFMGIPSALCLLPSAFLLWSFEPVAICSHHHYPLITQCPNCHQKLSILAANSRLGYCNHCGEWLGNVEKSKLLSHTLYHEEITLQSELINILGSLIPLSGLVSNDAKKRAYRQIITYFQLKELEITELSNHQISQKRVHRAMTYTGSTAQDFWRLLSGAALSITSKH